MANVPPPRKPPGSGSRLNIAPPAPENAPKNLDQPTEALVDFNFKIPESMHRKFKITAAMRGITMRELMMECWALYQERHPS